jgi:hypothetical protein
MNLWGGGFLKKRDHSTLTNTKPLNGPVGITDCGALIHTIHGGAGAGAGRLVDGRDGRGEHCTITGDFLFKYQTHHRAQGTIASFSTGAT